MRGARICLACLRAPMLAGPSRAMLVPSVSRSSSVRIQRYSTNDPSAYPPDDERTTSSSARNATGFSRNVDGPRQSSHDEEYASLDMLDSEMHAEVNEQLAYEFDEINLSDPELPAGRPFGMRPKPKQRNPYPSKIVLKEVQQSLLDEAEMEEEELDALREAERRKRKTEAKRRQKGGFADHIVIKVRGGRGGAGTASFGLTSTGRLGPPSGGNGGPGGSVYLTTSRQLTSLHTVKRRFLGGQGNNGAGDSKHGAKGEDVIIEVPVGTILREVAREGDEEKHWEIMERGEIPMEDRRKIRWSRWFTVQTGHAFEDAYFNSAERLLRKEHKWATRTPTFEEIPPKVYDLGEEVTEPIMITRGGSGGMGNPFFHGIDFQAPRLASRGIMPYTSTFEVELKLLADVGLVGFPNAGKSTILRALTGSRAEVASYEFTTLNPQVGVVRVWDDGSFGGGGLSGGTIVEDTWKERAQHTESRERGEYIPTDRIKTTREIADGNEGIPVGEKIERHRFTISDNPGLLPQASENVGLGHSFLRSIERSLALAYIIDLTRPYPADDLLSLRNELEAYKSGLAGIGAVVVLNKGDQVDEQVGRDKFARVKEAVAGLPEGGEINVVVLSGKYGLGLEKLVKVLGEKVEVAREKQKLEEGKGKVEEDLHYLGVNSLGSEPALGSEPEAEAQWDEGRWKEEIEERDILI